jgi:hypothetical protein
MTGVKLWVACKASDEKVFPIAGECVKLDIPLLLHSFNKTTGNMENETSSADVAYLAGKFPELTIIMAHLNGNGYKGVADVEPFPNVYVDTSGATPAAGLLEYAVEKIGASRLLFGSDAPGRGFDVQLGRIYGAQISGKDKELIAGKNAERILKL